MFDKNTLIAVVLILLVMQIFILGPQEKARKELETLESINTESNSGLSETDTAQGDEKFYGDKYFQVEGTSLNGASPVNTTIFEGGKISEKTIRVATDLYTLELSSSGGCITGCEISDYLNWQKTAPVILIKGGCGGALRLNVEGRILDMSDAAFLADRQEINLDGAGSVVDSLIFSLELEDGSLVERLYKFHNDNRVIECSVRMRNETGEKSSDRISIGWFAPVLPTEQSLKDETYYFSAMVCNDYMVNKKPLRKFNREPEWIIDSKVYWIGMNTKYFLAAFIPEESQRNIERPVVFRKPEDNKKATGLTFESEYSFDGDFEYQMYFGPLSDNELTAVSTELLKARQLGWNWLAPISNILLTVMKFLYKFIPNYGLVIILLSILVKILFWPLMRKQYESMAAMKKIQPHIEELKKKYKNDPQRMQKEQMELFKKHKVNPLGGCLPLLVQFPVMIALYQVFRGTIELRGEGFIFYLTDLASKDPYYILPVIMGLTMFIQQKMTIQDPRQMAMVYIMPVMLTFLFLSFPSGLVLYWTTVNILSIFQQLHVNKKKSAEAA